MWQAHLTVLLLATVGVRSADVTAGPGTVGPGGSGTCMTTVTWNETANTNVNGGVATTDATPELCKAACSANASCVGLDFDPANPTNKCWLTLSAALPLRTGLASGVTHYTITRPMATACQPTECVITSNPTANTNVLGGIPLNVATTGDCESTCKRNSTCIGFDWDPLGSPMCWLTFSGIKRVGLASGVTHYDISRSPAGCVPGTSIGVGCIWFSPSSGVAKVGPDNMVSFTKLLYEATVFQPAVCLGQSLSDVAFNETCVSFTTPDRPGWYVREEFGQLALQLKDNTNNYASRFAQDASFFYTQVSPKYYTIQPAAVDGFYLSADDKGHVVILQQDLPTQFYCGDAPPAGAVADQCPAIWSLVNNARVSESSGVVKAEDVDCRQQCLITPACVGVSILKGYRACLLVVDASMSGQLVSDEQYVHYDLWRPSNTRCQRGCLYTWTQRSSAMRLYQLYDPMRTTAFDCRTSCVKDTRCTSIVYDAGRCTMASDTNTTGVVGSTMSSSFWSLERIFTSCGDCVTSVGHTYGYTDPSAMMAQQITGSGQCLTVCVNKPGCVGYETINGSCFVSMAPNVTLVPMAGARHTDVIRSPCGNGCIHKWDLYVDTMMVGGAPYPTIQTEQACREACVNNAACSSIDWFQNSLNCTLGLSGNSADYGTAAGYNHYELSRNMACD